MRFVQEKDWQILGLVIREMQSNIFLSLFRQMSPILISEESQKNVVKVETIYDNGKPREQKLLGNKFDIGADLIESVYLQQIKFQLLKHFVMGCRKDFIWDIDINNIIWIGTVLL